MHTYIKYDKENPTDFDRAVEDAEKWMNPEQLNAVVSLIQSQTSEEYIRNMLGMIVGIEGYPVTCLIEKYRVKKQDIN